jgi:hypothetical protein
MSNVVPEQVHARPRMRTSAPRIVIDPSADAKPVIPQARRRQRSDDIEQMFIDLTRRAPAPAIGPSHWWG